LKNGASLVAWSPSWRPRATWISDESGSKTLVFEVERIEVGQKGQDRQDNCFKFKKKRKKKNRIECPKNWKKVSGTSTEGTNSMQN
jgi:hypothetical protein